MSDERQQAWQIANMWLDGRMNSLTQMVPGDPDCDACVLARQYMRALDKIAQLKEAYDEFMLDDNYDWAATLRSIMAKMRERSTGASASSRGQPAPDDGWRDIASAPKDGTPFLAWCPIIIGLGDSDATPDAEMRVIWWEARGQFTSDRDLGNESFTHWRPLPPPPAEREYDPRVAPCDDAEFGMKP